MFKQWLSRLEEDGWQITLGEPGGSLPEAIADRYPVPAAWECFIAPVQQCVSGDGTVRFLTFGDYQQEAEDACWNQFERRSTAAAGNDQEQCAAVTAFWNYHLPVVICSGSTSAYYAMDTQFGSVVYGTAAEPESPEVIAESFPAFIEKIISGEIKL
ncbi:MAG: hypothetical protein IKX57_02340 [Oscillospiraceae bacterium]|nr:hypothetical protein [Oscillospiraceae bacterium]MBR5722439.1 hypothetical protein [Oscillospiraceae bacterium]